MNFTNYKVFQDKASIFFVILLFVVLFFPFNNIYANGAWGWLTPKVEYLEEPFETTCDSLTQASLEILLVDAETKNIISNSIGKWHVIIRDSDLNTIDSKTMTGQKQSPKICFNPTNQGIQVVVEDSPNYYKFIGPTIKPSGSDLESLKGNNFRGYVQVSPKTSTESFVESVWPNGEMFADAPNFEVRTNYLNTLYAANEVKSITIYATDQLPIPTTYSKKTTTFGGVGTRFPSPPTGLSSGAYFWSFHQELNGSSITNKYTSPAHQWIFGGIPSSGAPDVYSFTIDKLPPVTQINSVTISEATNNDTEPVKIKIQNYIADSLSGLATTTIYVDDADGINMGSATIEYVSYVTSRYEWVEVSNLPRNTTYRIYAVTSDRLGNETTSVAKVFTVPPFLDVPTVINPAHSTTTVFGQHSLQATISALNGSPINKYAICWSTTVSADDELKYEMPGVDCNPVSWHFSPGWNYLFTIQRFYNNTLPTNTTIYFRGMAMNASGYGYSNILSFNTPDSPYDPSLSPPTEPKVEMWSPTVIKSDSLNPGVKITSAGGLGTINSFGICRANSELGANSIDPNNLQPTDDCQTWGPIINPTLPTPSHWYRHTFTDLDNGTTYFFKVFAINDIGVGELVVPAATAPISYYFRNGVDSPEVLIDNTQFNADSNWYDEITIRTYAVDSSSEWLDGGIRRIINYKAELDLYDDGIDIQTITSGETVTAHSFSESRNPLFNSDIKLYNVPLGNHKVTITVNDPETIYPQLNNTNRTTSKPFSLLNPNTNFDGYAGGEDSDGGDLIIDPELKIIGTPAFVRVGESTKLSWNMLNVSGTLNCRILGSDTFNSKPETSFTHTYVSVPPNITDISEEIDSGPLYSTQIFNFKCIPDPVTGTEYSTQTRVNVVGSPIEI